MAIQDSRGLQEHQASPAEMDSQDSRVQKGVPAMVGRALLVTRECQASQEFLASLEGLEQLDQDSQELQAPEGLLESRDKKDILGPSDLQECQAMSCRV